MGKEDQWAWARGPVTVGQLDHEMSSTKGWLTEFDNLWLTSTTAELNKKYSARRITVGVTEFTRLEPQVKQAERAIERNVAMHKVVVASWSGLRHRKLVGATHSSFLSCSCFPYPRCS